MTSKYSYSGYTTLLVTSILLLLALIASLASSKGVFFQIKVAQNEIKSRQAHWLAEGGVECAWAQFRVSNIVPEVITDCGSGLWTVPNFTSTSNGYLVTSNVGFTSISKEIILGGNLSYGAMQSSADIYFHSSATFSTPDPGELSSDGWECIALRYKKRFYSSSVDNKGVIHGESPYADFNNPTNKDCANTTANRHLSSSVGGVGAGDDFTQDTDLKPFESFFGVKAEEHNDVRDNGVFHVMTGSVAGGIPNCGAALTAEIQSGKHHLWVEGSCEIKQSEYNDLVNATSSTNGVTVLIHDGLFSVMGPPSSGATSNKFKGVLFHFNHDYAPATADWVGFEANAHLNHVPSVVEDSYRTIASYYQHGSFTVSGGQYFDSEDQAAVFFDSLDFRYNKDVIDNSRNAHAIPRWKKGSWNDL
ncbi:TPA: hypothetical protein ACPHTW_003877 [Vibrio antiquarius]